MKVISNHNLGKLYPDLVKEWHPILNGDLTPFDVTSGSDKKVWWKCGQGHEWKTRVSHRARGSGCPYCSGNKVGKDNNLAVKFPELIKDWEPTKNGELTPYNVMPRSHKKVWWKCSHGHEWKATIAGRTNGNGCPYCSGRKATKKNNLALKYPQIAKDWHPTKNGDLIPSSICPKSGKKVWWVCARGHEWQSSVAHRSNGRACPHCSPQTSRLEIRIYCEFKTIFNEVKWLTKLDGIECDVYLPKYKVGIELDGYPWHRDNEERDRNKSNIFLKQGISLVHVRDNRLKQISDRDILYNSHEKHFSIVRKILRSLMINVSLSKDDKIKMSNYLSLNKFQNIKKYKEIISRLPAPIPQKSFASLFPQLAGEWNFEKNKPLIPSLFAPKSHIKVWWKCTKGHEWKTAISERTRGRGCPKCSSKNRGERTRKAKLKMSGSLAENNPILANEWHKTKNENLTPEEVSPKSQKKVWWICNQGHEWKAIVYNRSNGTGCPKCDDERRRSS